MSMATNNETSFSFDESTKQSEEMHSTVEISVTDVNVSQGSEASLEWLDLQSRFQNYSYRNTLLINQQYQEAKRDADY